MRVIELARRRRNIRPFFLDTNGVTIKLKQGYSVGATGLAEGDTSGKVYTAVDNTTLYALPRLTTDFSLVCTTLVNNLQNFFGFQGNNFDPNLCDISGWDVSNVTNFNSFSRQSNINFDLSKWDMNSATSIERMFDQNDLFNSELNEWVFPNVTSLLNLFNNANNFNQPLNNWDVSGITSLNGMFTRASSFNQNISSWNVSNVTNMGNMFFEASSFNEDLSTWCVEQIPTEPTGFATGATAWVLPKPNWGIPC